MRRVWPWMLVIAAVIAGIVAVVTLCPEWIQRIVAVLGVGGVLGGGLWGARQVARPVEVSTSEPHDLAAAEADRQLEELDALARADTDEARAVVDTYRDVLLAMDGDAVAAELGRVQGGRRPPGAPVPRPMPGHGADPDD